MVVASKSPEAILKRLKTWNERVASGEIKIPRGQENKRWSGGKRGYYERNKDKYHKWTKEYRDKNPHKVREFTERRDGRKYGRLPKGTILRLMELQKGRCAVCGAGIRENFHVDHIVPLARGGKHEKANVQLLCPSCNCHKSAKDPIDFMQQRGFLL